MGMDWLNYLLNAISGENDDKSQATNALASHFEEKVATECQKYKLLLDDSLEAGGRKYYRIQANEDFGDVRKGDKGGYVESFANLAKSGNSWVYEGSKVGENARVFGDAQIRNSQIFGDAYIGGASVLTMSVINGNVHIGTHENASPVVKNTAISGSVYVEGEAVIADLKIDGKGNVLGKDGKTYADRSVNIELPMDGEDPEAIGSIEQVNNVYLDVLKVDPALVFGVGGKG
jgi:hypothetical protein